MLFLLLLLLLLLVLLYISIMYILYIIFISPPPPPPQESDHHQRMLLEVMKQDSLRKIELEERAKAEQCILTAAKLIAPVIEGSFASGFDW